MAGLKTEMPQLEMLWPTHSFLTGRREPVAAEEQLVDQVTDPVGASQRATPSLLPLQLAPGYRLRVYQPGVDDEAYLALMAAAGFEDWSADRLILCQMTALPNGWFLVEDERTGAVAATAMATHRPTPYHAFGGELGWVAAHPDHRGHRLGWTVCAAATNRLLRAGYDNIYLKTDDWRAPAILIYLRMGYVPFLSMSGMAARWKSICTVLDWPYTPETWPTASA